MKGGVFLRKTPLDCAASAYSNSETAVRLKLSHEKPGSHPGSSFAQNQEKNLKLPVELAGRAGDIDSAGNAPLAILGEMAATL
jgi:hypothetical protein